MGVPAFYRWVLEKYPKCVVDCVEQRAVVLEGERHYELLDTTGPNPNGFEVDNLYVDMNGLIHPCCHPENGDAPKTEEEMYRRVMAYVDRLVAAVRPRRVLYLAIDGVAPRAKMNQQRARRFRAAQEAEQRAEIEKEAFDYMRAMGHNVPDKQDKGWDSNVITPGTKFMSKLAKYVRFYIRDRINNNPAWKSIKVIFSDAGCPGEGEHKLMSYIRLQRAQPDYDANQHHVLHGLDADLIMLGLATHEVKFSILREEVLFGKAKYERERQQQNQTMLDANGVPSQKRKRGDFGEHDADAVASDLKPLQFLHIATLREYLQIEFEPLSRVLPFEYDFERIVDDFVFLCFFVGNDFLPHLPSLDIRDGALDFLILIYAKLLPALGGYLTDAGHVNLSRVDVILAEVGAVEDVVFQRRAMKQEENERRRKQRMTNEKKDQLAASAAKEDAVEIVKKRRVGKQALEHDKKYGGLTAEEAVKARIKETVEQQLEKYREEVQDVVRLGEPGWKTRYYTDKLKAEDIEHGGGREKVFQTYIEGLCWVMQYYYHGCPSWKWFYPFHYAPFASDLRNIDRFEIKFEEGTPFCPFEQLMGVFPAGSSHAIPKPYRWLMTEEESPIIDFYPKEIPVDPNGKAMPWLWVVLLPFIDESRLLAAMAEGNKQLTEAERKRNERYGKEIVFFHSKCPVTRTIPTAEAPEAQAESAMSGSFTGTLIYIESIYFPIGCVVPSPEKSQRYLQDVPNNQCYSFQFRPPPKLPHRCVILDDAIAPPQVLVSPNDRQISIPFFGKAHINIVDLAGGATANLTNVRHRNHHHGDSRRGDHNRRGNGGYVNNNLNVDRYGGGNGGGRPEYNQYLTNGYGNWGSQEPRNKRGQYGGNSGGHGGSRGGGGGGGGYGNYQNYQQQPQQHGGRSSGYHQSSNYGDQGSRGYHSSYNNNQQHQGGSRSGYNSGYGQRSGYSNASSYGSSSHHQGGHAHRSGSGAPIQSAFGGSLQPTQSFSASGAAPARPSIEALKAGLRNMHQQRSQPSGGHALALHRVSPRPALHVNVRQAAESEDDELMAPLPSPSPHAHPLRGWSPVAATTSPERAHAREPASASRCPRDRVVDSPKRPLRTRDVDVERLHPTFWNRERVKALTNLPVADNSDQVPVEPHATAVLQRRIQAVQQDNRVDVPELGPDERQLAATEASQARHSVARELRVVSGLDAQLPTESALERARVRKVKKQVDPQWLKTRQDPTLRPLGPLEREEERGLYESWYELSLPDLVAGGIIFDDDDRRALNEFPAPTELWPATPLESKGTTGLPGSCFDSWSF
ncbi:hypothetical protein ATCC90586_001530 [Pythium insidiosum]|nr:hypothetical protein ATCC90586_001530 [Pythium insidiosum]